MSEAKKKTGDKSHKIQVTLNHKVRRLRAHVKKFPNDEKSVQALNNLEKNEKFTPRSAPRSRKWSSVSKSLAEVHRLAGYNGNSVLKFGIDGVSVYSGMKSYALKETNFKKAKFLDAIQKKAEERNDELKKTRQNNVDAERKKLQGKQKGRKPGQPKKPQAKK